MSNVQNRPRWGEPPWKIDFQPAAPQIPEEVDFAVIGGGLTGLSASAWLRRLAPLKSVALLESTFLGGGASSYTGGVVLAETAAGDLPGLGDVLAGFSDVLQELAVDCDLTLPGAWEIGRSDGLPDSPIAWTDSGELRGIRLVAGGTADPGKLVSGLARAAEGLGVQIFENTEVENVEFHEPLRLNIGDRVLRAQNVLFATNAMSLELSGLIRRAQPNFTLAVATEPLADAQRAALGLESGMPFYTTDFPFLWGRLAPSSGVIFGSGLVHVSSWRDLVDLDIAGGEAGELMARLERRVRGLHPVLHHVRFARRWGGPILITEHWVPAFLQHPESPRAMVLGAYSGHGVALSVYLGRWAAEAMLGRRALPDWTSA